MKYLLLLLIRMYWLVPKKFRRRCIFKNTCSHFIYETIRQRGALQGLKALQQRFRQCRGNYSFYETNQQQWVILNDLSVVERADTNL
jgi:hypothetical protein